MPRIFFLTKMVFGLNSFRNDYYVVQSFDCFHCYQTKFSINMQIEAFITYLVFGDSLF